MATGEGYREQPKLPALLTADDVPAVLASFVVEQEGFGRPIKLDRMPTAAERDLLQHRLRLLDSALANVNDRGAAERVLAVMFAGFPQLQKAAVADLLDAYWAQLEGQPAVCIAMACHKVSQKLVPLLDCDYPPTAPRMVDLARREASVLRGERFAIDRILRATELIPRAPDAASRARIGAGLKSLANEIRLRGANDSVGQYKSGVR